MSQPFRYRLRVRYSECDAQKVVFNARYGGYVDLAVLEFVRTLGVMQLIEGPLDFQLVKQTTEWQAPARFDQVVDVAVRTVRLGTTSFTLATDFSVDGKPVARIETVYVMVMMATLAKCAIPDDIRATLERGAPDLVVDHSDSTPRAS